MFAVLLLLAFLVCITGCGQEAVESPNLKYYDNGYGTYYVLGTRIEHPADTSTSIEVDWSHAKAGKAPEDLQLTEEHGIVYSHSTMTDGREEGQPLDLHLNLMVPGSEDGASAMALKPVVLLVPGGAFITCRIDDKYVNVQRYFAAHGYAVAIMQYHVVGQGRYTDAAEDVREAIGWIREHGTEYGLDADRIALVGNSAGGYVAALAACQGEAGNLRDNAAGELPGVRCVVNFYGLSDLMNNSADYEDAAVEAEQAPNSSESQFVNGALSGVGLADAPEEAVKADPVTFIDGSEPPFLHLHGDADLWVSPSQSVYLHEALQAAGVETTRYSVKGAGHADKQFRTADALDVVLEFMDRHCGSGSEERPKK